VAVLVAVVFGTVCLFVVGMAMGALVLARWYAYRLRKPDVARDVLKTVYRSAHPHWLQRSQGDGTPICPVCGWSETEALAPALDPNAAPAMLRDAVLGSRAP
jgi:hypothetical protein